MQQDVASANASLDGRRTQIDGGTPPATIEFRTGAPPASTTTADSGTLLSTHALANPSAPAAANRVLTFSTIATANAVAGGTPGHYRIKQGGTNTVKAQGTAGVGSGEWNFAAAPVLNSTITPGSWTWTDNTG